MHTYQVATGRVEAEKKQGEMSIVVQDEARGRRKPVKKFDVRKSRYAG